MARILGGSLTMQMKLYNQGELEFLLPATQTVTVNSYDGALVIPVEGQFQYNYGYYFNYMIQITKKYTAAATTSPMQVVISLTNAVAADTSITLTMLEDVFTPTVSGSTHLLCYFRKMSDTYLKNYGAKLLSPNCSYTAQVFTIVTPSLATGNYQLTITTLGQSTNGVVFAVNQGNYVGILSFPTTATTITFTSPAYYCQTGDLLSMNNQAEQLSIIEIKFSKTAALAVPVQAAGSNEVELWLQFDEGNFENDLGASTLNSIEMTKRFPVKVYVGTTEQTATRLRVAKKWQFILFNLDIAVTTSTDTITIKIPYIKNPIFQFNFKLLWVMFASDKPLPIYLYQHEFWGYLDMITTASTYPQTKTSEISSSSIQVVNGDMDFKVQMGGTFVKSDVSRIAFQFSDLNTVVVGDLGLLEVHTDNPADVFEYYETIHLFIVTLTNNLLNAVPVKFQKLHIGEYETNTFGVLIKVFNSNKFLYQSSCTNQISSRSWTLASYTRMLNGDYYHQKCTSQYRIVLQTSAFLSAGSYTEIYFSNTIRATGYEKQDLSYCFYYGPTITDNTVNKRRIQCSLTNDKLTLSGYQQIPANTFITIYAYMRHTNHGKYTLQINTYHDEASPATKKQASGNIFYTWNAASGGVPTEYDQVADMKEVFTYSSQWGPLYFIMQANAVVGTGYTIEITLPQTPTAFTLPTATHELKIYYGQYLNQMIPGVDPTWTSPTLSFKIYEDYTIPATTDYYILVKTDLVDVPATNFNSVQHGADDDGTLVVPTANFYEFGIAIKNAGATIVEAGITDYINLPQENVKSGILKGSMTALVQSIGLSGCMYFELTLSHNIAVGDQIIIGFRTEDGMTIHQEEFPEHLGYSFSTSALANSKSIKMSAAEPPSVNVLSTVQLEGLIIKGEKSTSTAAQILIYVNAAVTKSTSISFYIPDIQNPAQYRTYALPELTIRRKCRNDGLTCTFQRKTMKYLTINQWIDFSAAYTSLAGPLEVSEEWECLSEKSVPNENNALNCNGYSYSSCKLDLDNTVEAWQIEQMDQNHFIRIFPDYEVTTTDYFQIYYPTHNFHEINSILDNSCLSTGFCITFPHQQLLLIKLPALQVAKTEFTLQLSHMANAFYCNDWWYNSTDTTCVRYKQIDFETRKIVGRRKYKQWQFNPLYETELTGGVKVRMLVEPTQSVVRQYPQDLDNKFINFTDYDYFQYDPIHIVDDAEFETVIATWTQKYYFLAAYWNTIKVQVMHVWNRNYISYFQLWLGNYDGLYRFYDTLDEYGQEYCNATMDLKHDAADDEYVKPHPIQFKCQLDKTLQYKQYEVIRIFPSGYYPFPSYNAATFVDAIFTVYCKMYIHYSYSGTWSNPGTWRNVSNIGSHYPMKFCGCHNQFSDSWTTCGNFSVYISPWHQPYRSSVSFNRLSFQDRIARPNQEVDLYFLLETNTQYHDDPINFVQINTLKYHVPDAFTYSTAITYNYCYNYGYYSYTTSNCHVSRTNSKTLAISPLQNYDHNLTMSRFTHYTQSERFKSPDSITGSSLEIGLELYQDTKLWETWKSNVTILGDDLLHFYARPPLDPGMEGLFFFSFETGDYLTPEGYATPSNQRYSSLQIIFESMNIMNGYEEDLGTGLQTGDEIGCSAYQGLDLVNKERFKCILHVGTTVEDKPFIEMFNYEEIAAHTNVTIMFVQLKTIAADKWTYAYAGIRVYYKEKIGVVQFYNLVNDMQPAQASASVAVAASGYSDIIVTGSNQVNGQANYEMKVVLANTIKWNCDTDFIAIKFPENMFNKYLNVSEPKISLTGKLFVFGAANMFYIKPTVSDYTGTLLFNLSNIENPEYTFDLTEFEITAHEIVDNKQKQHFKYKVKRQIIPCEQFTVFNVTASSSIGGENNVTYEISIVSGHKIPNEGYLKIVFPEEYDSLEDIQGKCQLENFGPLTTCLIKTYGIDIVFNGDAFNESKTYKLQLIGMNNPNVAMQTKQFIITSQYSITNSSKQICSMESYAPGIEIQKIKKCQFTVAAMEQTQSLETNYDFKFYCEADIREGSLLMLILPKEYEEIYKNSIQQSAEKALKKQCFSDDGVLRSNDCELSLLGENIVITAQLHIFAQNTNFALQIQKIQNPSEAGAIKNFKLNITSNSVLYIQEKVPTLLIITENNYMIDSSAEQINVTLQNLPITPGQPAAYIFSIEKIQEVPSYEFTGVKVKFSEDYSENLSDQLECGAFITDARQDYSFDQMLKYFSNSTSSGYTYYSFPCTVSSREVLITEIDWLIKKRENKYINWVINNVANPSTKTTQSFAFLYKSGTAVIYNLQQDFTIQLGLPAAEHYLSQDIYLTSYNIKSYSYYKFFIQLTQDLIKYQKLGILVTLPKAYNEVLSYQKSLEYYCSTGLNSLPGSTTECTFYNRQLMFIEYNNLQVDLSEQNSSYSFDLIITNMVNPVIETTCNTSSSELNTNFMFYEIKLINLLGNEVISSNFQATDTKNCIQFVQDLYLIDLKTPTSNIYPGYSYNLTLTLEMPSDGITLTPSVPTTNKIRFNPSQIIFSDYLTTEQTFELIADQLLKPGIYYIKWEKQEASGFNYFTELLDTKIVVKMKSSPKESITISPRSVIGIQTKVELAVTLSVPPSHEFKFKISSSDKRILVVEPTTLYFNETTIQQYFTIYAKQETNAQQLQFSLLPNSIYDNYKLSETSRTIYIQEQPSNYYYKIVNIESQQIGTNNIILSILSSEQYSKLSYCTCYLNSPEPSQEDIVGRNYSKAVVSGQLYASEHNVELNISGLESNTEYVFYCIGQGMHTYSKIKSINFTTGQTPRAAIVRFELNSDNVADNTIISAFAYTFRLPQKRFVIRKKYQFEKTINKKLMNSRPVVYEIMIVPDPLDNTKKPIEYAKMLKQTKVANFFKKSLPYLTNINSISSYEYFPIPPQVAEEPKVTRITYYSATIKMKFWKQCKVYAIRICSIPNEQKLKSTKIPLSQQIFKGMDQENEKLDKTNYYKYSGVTQIDGSIEIFLDDLKAGMECQAFITAGSDVPFEPADLMENKEVRIVEFTTPENLNLN